MPFFLIQRVGKIALSLRFKGKSAKIKVKTILCLHKIYNLTSKLLQK